MADIPRWLPLSDQAEQRRQRAAELRAQIEKFEAIRAEFGITNIKALMKKEARA
ncbi:hypothetical protein SAMN04244572_04356 [Azotobacter beijerinckii]|uniref:Uncharacterized protein n=1 Tax=Azotobacter beijerinckii TaxID=170623 RepID=A0A1H6ZTH3_9GAMM|nr:hypothetical protein [Azotobacter beijerinckii]SEJ52992.1 hypothetical protein SAMN04244572_04356 [Azotobacter beijerinckii]